MSVTVQQLQDYAGSLDKLCIAEQALVDGGLIFEHECLSHYNADFIKGRLQRINNLIASGRYE